MVCRWKAQPRAEDEGVPDGFRWRGAAPEKAEGLTGGPGKPRKTNIRRTRIPSFQAVPKRRLAGSDWREVGCPKALSLAGADWLPRVQTGPHILLFVEPLHRTYRDSKD